jgi:23S rRNA pseudouridine2605 synthase
MRLNKYIAASGIASRRKADELTKTGKVKINGKTFSEPGYVVMPGDLVEVNGCAIAPVKRLVYIMLNKPRGYITSVSDDKDRPTVMDLISDLDTRLFPIGRLDYNSSGLLLLTNDGEFSYQMTHPKHLVEKTYKVKVTGKLSEDRIEKLRNGINIDGFVTSPAKVRILRQMERSSLVEIKIHEGKNRQVRKMFAAVGNRVIDLERTAIGGLSLGPLKVGHYRKLSIGEVERLRSFK